MSTGEKGGGERERERARARTRASERASEREREYNTHTQHVGEEREKALLISVNAELWDRASQLTVLLQALSRLSRRLVLQGLGFRA